MKTQKQLKVDSLIEKRVSVEEFSHEMQKSGVQVVTPEQTVSAVYYRDERRFFPTLNDMGRVVGGYFG